jgi:hypothetical protein
VIGALKLASENLFLIGSLWGDLARAWPQPQKLNNPQKTTIVEQAELYFYNTRNMVDSRLPKR